jgi:carotenoid cleavage dioxygenase-like enzyme
VAVAELVGPTLRNVANTTIVPGLHFIHDFVVTPRWYVLPGNAMKAKPAVFAQAMIGIKTLIDAVAVDTSLPGVLILVPRGRSGPVRSVTLPQNVCAPLRLEAR